MTMTRKTQMKSNLTFVGVGDLHLDGKLSKFIPDFNHVIMNEVRTGPIRHAVRNGIPIVIFYGDICDVPRMSAEATELLLDLFYDHPSLRFILMTGNHDTESTGVHSLRVLKKMVSRKALNNVRIIDKPTTLFKNSDTPVRILPWPSFDVDKSCLNVLHVEVNGSQWDHGKAVESERSTSAVCVSGHLHTKQKIRNTNYCGTLYQTSFGEKPDKYFHVVSWDSGSKPEIELVPHKPVYTLHNLIITSEEDLSKISSSPTDLYKVFVKADAVLDPESLQGRDNVVKINSFKSRQELEALIAEDLLMQDTSERVNTLSVVEALKRYMVRSSVDTDRANRALQLFDEIIKNAKKQRVS